MRPLVLAGIGLVLSTLACHSVKLEGAHAQFSVPSARYPLSFTSALVDQNGIVAPTRIHRVGKFAYESDGCIKKVDLSESVNRAISGVQGDALVNLIISSRSTSDCIEAKISGEIVKVDP